MIVKFEREGLNDEMFVINWPDSQLRFHLIRRGDKLEAIKEAVYVLMDKFRTEFYIGETGDLMSRFRTHRWQREFWHCALVIEDRNEEFKKQDVRKWFEWRLFQIASERSLADKKYKIDSSAGKQADKSYLENRVNDILAVCRFLGIPWGYAETNKHKAASEASDSKPSVPEEDATKQPAPGFAFEMAKIPENAELVFVEGGQHVRAIGKNRVVYCGETYSLTGFAKKFMPADKRRKNESYQGPAYFTYKGSLLTVLRKKYEGKPRSGVASNKTKGRISKEVCSSGLTKTQLAKKIATLIDGRDGAFGGILQYFSRFKSCPKTGKWRKPLTDVGIAFDKQDFVIDWRAAKL